MMICQRMAHGESSLGSLAVDEQMLIYEVLKLRIQVANQGNTQAQWILRCNNQNGQGVA
jgi:hypothetical protein